MQLARMVRVPNETRTMPFARIRVYGGRAGLDAVMLGQDESSNVGNMLSPPAAPVCRAAGQYEPKARSPGTGLACNFSSRQGFTLLETLLAAAVIGILAALAVPSIAGHIPLRRVEASAHRLTGNFISARARAISQNTSYIIKFTSSTTYTIHKDGDGDGVQDIGEDVQTVTLEAGTKLGANAGLTNVDNNPLNTSGLHFGGDNALAFDSRGECSESGSVYLIPTDDLSAPIRNDRARAVSVLQATGRVKLWRYNVNVANPGPWE